MIILTRRIDEAILIGDNIRVMVVDIQRHAPDGSPIRPKVRLGIDAPREISIVRPTKDAARGEQGE